MSDKGLLRAERHATHYLVSGSKNRRAHRRMEQSHVGGMSSMAPSIGARLRLQTTTPDPLWIMGLVAITARVVAGQNPTWLVLRVMDRVMDHVTAV